MKRILLIILLGLMSCAVFKKTSKENTIATKSITNQLEYSQLVLKNADKETQIFTYWNDSGFYQYQHIKEQIDQAKLSNVKTEEKLQAKQKVTVKNSEPVNSWVYAALLIGLVVVYWLFRRFVF